MGRTATLRLGIGEAMAGVLPLAVVTNLCTMAITVTTALRHNLGLATGNFLGGIAIQTAVLVALDGFSVPGILTMVYLWGLIFRPQRLYFRPGPESLLVLALYVVGLGAVARG